MTNQKQIEYYDEKFKATPHRKRHRMLPNMI